MPLTDDARKELREAIAIVREDRFERFVRGTVGKKKDPLIDPEPEPEKDPNDPVPPPPKDPEKDPEPPKVRKSAYWGEILDDA